jgi:hypothetical protein
VNRQRSYTAVPHWGSERKKKRARHHAAGPWTVEDGIR